MFEIIFQPKCGNLFSNLLFETPFLIIVALLGTVDYFKTDSCLKKRSNFHCASVWMNIFLPGTFFLHAAFFFVSFTPSEKKKNKNKNKIQLNKQTIRKQQQQQGIVYVDKCRKT